MDLIAARERFERNGFAVVPNLFESRAIELTIGHLRSLRARLGLSCDAPIVAALPGDPVAASLAGDARLTALASAALGAEVCCFSFSYLSKPPGTGLPARWHQDGGPWAALLKGTPALTIWIALTDADEANGCLPVVAGSHRLAVQPLVPDDREPSFFGVGMELDHVDEANATSLVVNAGDVVMHHPNLIHGSFANRSGTNRIALAIRYRTLDADARSAATGGGATSGEIPVT